MSGVNGRRALVSDDMAMTLRAIRRLMLIRVDTLNRSCGKPSMRPIGNDEDQRGSGAGEALTNALARKVEYQPSRVS